MQTPRTLGMLQENALLALCQLCCLPLIPSPKEAYQGEYVGHVRVAVREHSAAILACGEQIVLRGKLGGYPEGEILEGAAYLIAALCRSVWSYSPCK